MITGAGKRRRRRVDGETETEKRMVE